LGAEKMDITVVMNDEARTTFIIKGDTFHVENDYLVIYDPKGQLLFVSGMPQILFAGVMQDVK
jgi:hypothetical protein